MKMEIPVETPLDGTIAALAAPGTQVVDGDVVALVDTRPVPFIRVDNNRL
jgi:biotin carboxyl carrier protein